MTKINDLSQGDLDQIRRQRHRDQYATPLNGASVGSGGMRFYDEGQLRVENDGGLVVVGSAEIIGEMIGSGKLDWSGIVNISGPLVVQDGGSVTIGSIKFLPDGSAAFDTLTIGPDGTLETGSAKINPDGSADFGEFSIAANGDLVSKGTLDIQGEATLKADLNVTTGKIKVGTSMTLDPNVSSGALVFSNGAQVFTDGSTIQIYKGTSAVTVADGTATLQGTGSSFVRSSAAGIKLGGLPTTSEPANLHIDGSGNVSRSTA